MKPTQSLNQLLFIAASNFSVEEERRAFLEFACRDDEDRLKRLEVLLEARQDADEFFESQPKPVEKVAAADGSGEEGSLGTRIGPYRLIDRLGAGGCGVVYLAEQQEPVRRKVALKIIRIGMDSENVIARFAMEQEALALMDHPNIARVLDAGTTFSGRPYFVMELVDGERITDFCDLKHFGVRERMELFIQVCEAIQHAHQKGVIHRDIKPSNVLVRDHDGRAVPKVIDFGISIATSADLDGDAALAGSGTPSYMSPEQAEGSNDIDTRSDIYSLGALLCELLTGHPPVDRGRFKERGVEDDGAEPPDPQLTGDLVWIVRKAVEKDRQHRYETANGLGRDVRRFLNEEPVTARPPSRRYLFTKLVRRNWLIFAAGSVAMFGLLGGFGVSTWLFLRERDARQEAENARAREVLLNEKARAADLVARAAVHVNYNEMEQADSLLAGLTVEKTPLSLEAANTLRTVADWNLTKGRWKTAAKRFSVLVPVITSVDLTDTDQMSRILMPAATAIKEWGEPAEYDHLRELAIRRFADSSNHAVAAQVSKAVLLEPADEATLRGLVPLSAVLDSALTGPNADDTQYVSAWRQFSFALLNYRQGNFERAVFWARKSSASATINQLKVSIRILLAMIDLRQGRTQDAEATLKEARQQIERWQAMPFHVGTSVDLWFDWGNARILLKEAERMLAAPGR